MDGYDNFMNDAQMVFLAVLLCIFLIWRSYSMFYHGIFG